MHRIRSLLWLVVVLIAMTYCIIVDYYCKKLQEYFEDRQLQGFFNI